MYRFTLRRLIWLCGLSFLLFQFSAILTRLSTDEPVISTHQKQLMDTTSKMNPIENPQDKKNIPKIKDDVKIESNGQIQNNDIIKKPIADSQKNSKETAMNPPKSEDISKQCPVDSSLTFAKTDFWQQLQTSAKDSKFYIFSAYMDMLWRKSERYVRLVGTTTTSFHAETFCKLWYSDGKTETVPSINNAIKENWGMQYSAYFYLCTLPNKETPCAVSILSGRDSPPLNILPVHNNEFNIGLTKGEFGLCVKPLHYEYTKYLQFVEFIELQQILGVEHFTFYLNTVSENMTKILTYYEKKGIIDVLPWKIDIKSQKEVRTENMFAALNDCLLRYRYRFKYVLMIDLDEYIIPYEHNTLNSMMSDIHLSHRDASFIFRNGFFYLQHPDDMTIPDNPPLSTLRKTTRLIKLHPHNQRSKYIVDPLGVAEVGNHFVWSHISGYTTKLVSDKIAFTHHYRICEFGGDDCVKLPHTTDRRAHYFASKLLPRVKQVFINLEFHWLLN
ncbi:unnamed protein product [Owenia fusiformis]|uniref:Glycosyltransferase family 92 protein n=1 Tax=Owenia fusiformis TaxID=6347 RepID=A0A8J1Y5E7_OWEFU|nr:unnamed protein product [Owenia fusiformis]